MNENKGRFIVLEGIDGAGKTTQAELLEKYLVASGRQVARTAEPTGYAGGVALRAALGGKVKKSECEMAAMFVLDRIEHNIHEGDGIEALLADGYDVICDRYYDSSYAYQLAGRRISEDVLDQLNDLVVKDAHPDMTFLLDLTLDVSLQRVSGRGEADRLELEGLAFKQRVRDGFLAQAKKHPDRICVVDASKSPEGIFNDILWHLEQRGIKA